MGKESIKMSRILWFLFSLGVTSVCVAQVEERVDLGDGYDAAVIAKPSGASFESVGHWEYLRYKEKELCLLGRYALSPDGRFIAFQESNTGKVFLLDKKEHTKVELIAKFLGLVLSYDWKAKTGFLTLEIYEKGPLVLALPPVQKKKP
jgi:hypothetical protein